MKKLKKGDYVTDLSSGEFYELMEFQPKKYFKYIYNDEEKNIIIWNGNFLSAFLKKPKTELTFEEFKQRAINTFGNGAKD